MHASRSGTQAGAPRQLGVECPDVPCASNGLWDWGWQTFPGKGAENKDLGSMCSLLQLLSSVNTKAILDNM